MAAPRTETGAEIVNVPDHREIYTEIGVLKAAVGTLQAETSSIQREVTEFKNESSRYRDEQRSDVKEIKSAQTQILSWVNEQKTQRLLIKKAWKVFAAIVAVAAAGVAIFKGLR